jgi:hypothetical protein
MVNTASSSTTMKDTALMLSERYPLTCPRVQLSEGSLVRGFTCPTCVVSCPTVGELRSDDVIKGVSQLIICVQKFIAETLRVPYNAFLLFQRV